MSASDLPNDAPATSLFPQFSDQLYQMISGEVQDLTDVQLDFESERWEASSAGGETSQAIWGDGTTLDSGYPGDVTGLTSGVAAVSAGNQHTCALTTSGGLKCWGENGDGRLGDGTTKVRTAPVDVFGLSNNVASLSVGAWHTCIVTTAGGVKCWGDNQFGQMGDGTDTVRTAPVDVIGLTRGVVAVSAGSHHTCALTNVGAVKCWELNEQGQLGVDTTLTGISTGTPMDVPGLAPGVTAITSGPNHNCVTTESGGIKCWGANAIGQLGDGTTTDSTGPVDVVGITGDVVTISASGSANNCAVTRGGIKCSPNHTCVLTAAGAVQCWGPNTWGQLGDGTNTDRAKPVDVIGFLKDSGTTPTR